MAFTDLDEHVAEVFGDARAEDQHTTSVQSPRGSRGFRSKQEKRRLEHQRRIRRAMERFLQRMMSGEIPSTCRGPYCMSLLAPQRGVPKGFCSDDCKKVKAKVMRRLNG